ncbi:MAG TPA: C1 family peptidase, partial [Minicystis sp.]|nr:C1 family peptidase [Minicystis sp.]
ADGKLATTALDEEDLGAAVEVPQLRAKLAAGEDVLVALKVGPTFKPVGKPGAMYVPHYEGGKGAHALLVVGYATYPHGTYFLVKNSVGEKWGDQGYAWLHENTLKANIAHAYVVDARPADASKLKRKVHKPQAGPCKPGTFPDAISGACSPVCSDRGPRYDNVCPKKDECPKGQVNLWGECVLAAPAGARSEPKERELRYACGAGGCTFRAKRGVAGCEKETCPISCPAPTFRPMGGEKDVVCWE